MMTFEMVCICVLPNHNGKEVCIFNFIVYFDLFSPNYSLVINRSLKLFSEEIYIKIILPVWWCLLERIY